MRKRKLLSLLLCLMMLSSAIGAPVYADETENVSILTDDYSFDEVSEIQILRLWI